MRCESPFKQGKGYQPRGGHMSDMGFFIRQMLTLHEQHRTDNLLKVTHNVGVTLRFIQHVVLSFGINQHLVYIFRVFVSQLFKLRITFIFFGEKNRTGRWEKHVRTRLGAGGREGVGVGLEIGELSGRADSGAGKRPQKQQRERGTNFEAESGKAEGEERFSQSGKSLGKDSGQSALEAPR